MAAQSSKVVWEAAAGRRRWLCQGVGDGTSVDIGGGDEGSSGGGRGGAVALALLGLRWGRAADALARAACSRPKVAGGGQQHPLCLALVGVRPLMRWLALRARNSGQGGAGSAALAGASVDVYSGDGAGRGYGGIGYQIPLRQLTTSVTYVTNSVIYGVSDGHI